MAEKSGIVRHSNTSIDTAVAKSSTSKFTEGLIVGGLASLTIPLVAAYGDQKGWFSTMSPTNKRWTYTAIFAGTAYLTRKSMPGLAIGLGIGAAAFALLPMVSSVLNNVAPTPNP